MGAGARYWFSPFETIGSSLNISLSDGNAVSGGYSAFYSFNVNGGIWATTTATLTDAEFSARLFSLRQTLSVRLGNENYIIGYRQLGRGGFFFDDEAMIAYNQRAVLTGSFMLKGIIHLSAPLYVVPTLQYDLFDG